MRRLVTTLCLIILLATPTAGAVAEDNAAKAGEISIKALSLGGRKVRALVFPPDHTERVVPASALYYLTGPVVAGDPFPRPEAVARRAARFGFFTVVPLLSEEDPWFGINHATDMTKQYQDFFCQDLVAAVEAKFDVRKETAGRCIMGYGPAGYGALRIYADRPKAFASASSMNGWVCPSMQGSRATDAIARLMDKVAQGDDLKQLDLPAYYTDDARRQRLAEPNVYISAGYAYPTFHQNEAMRRVLHQTRVAAWNDSKHIKFPARCVIMGGDFAFYWGGARRELVEREADFHVLYHRHVAKWGPVGALDHSRFSRKDWAIKDKLNFDVPSGTEVYPNLFVHKLHSTYLDKELRVFVAVPPDYKTNSNKRYPVVYLLPTKTGGGVERGQPGAFFCTLRGMQWCQDFGMVIVSPEMRSIHGNNEPWYVESIQNKNMRQTSYFRKELIPFVDSTYQTVPHRWGRATLGKSKGGHGGWILHLHEMDLFGAGGSVEGNLEVRFGLGWGRTQNFGPLGSREHREFDSPTLLRSYTDEIRHDANLMLCAGTCDFFTFEAMRQRDELVHRKIPHRYAERPGTHSNAYSNHAFPFHLQFFAHAFADCEGKSVRRLDFAQLDRREPAAPLSESFTFGKSYTSSTVGKGTPFAGKSGILTDGWAANTNSYNQDGLKYDSNVVITVDLGESIAVRKVVVNVLHSCCGCVERIEARLSDDGFVDDNRLFGVGSPSTLERLPHERVAHCWRRDIGMATNKPSGDRGQFLRLKFFRKETKGWFKIGEISTY